MSEGLTALRSSPQRPDSPADAPPPDVVAFIKFCHTRKPVGWPELYDEMCGVAARREFRGWGYDELAARGVTFALRDMIRLAGWARAVTGPRLEEARAPGSSVTRGPLAEVAAGA